MHPSYLGKKERSPLAVLALVLLLTTSCASSQVAVTAFADPTAIPATATDIPIVPTPTSPPTDSQTTDTDTDTDTDTAPVDGAVDDDARADGATDDSYTAEQAECMIDFMLAFDAVSETGMEPIEALLETDGCASLLGPPRGSPAPGDDVALDALWEDCRAGSGAACDTLFFESPYDSDYETFGNSCGGRTLNSPYCEEFFAEIEGVSGE